MTRRTPLLVLLLLVGTPPVWARLDAKDWKDVEERANHLFGSAGHRAEKAEVLTKLLEDDDRRSWKVLADAVVKEAETWVVSERTRQKLESDIQEIQSKTMAQRHPDDQAHLLSWRAQLQDLDVQVRDQRGALGDVTDAVAEGPAALRQNLLSRAKSSKEWAVRAAAVRVSAAHLDEKECAEVFLRGIEKDPDPRVRMAGLDALRVLRDRLGGGETIPAGDGTPPAGAGDPPAGDATPPKPAVKGTSLDQVEALILGRLADPDWGVQLVAVHVVTEAKLTRAVPHLINALSVANPRMAEAIGDALRTLTGQNFDPFADVWAHWWEEHKGDFQSAEHVKGDRSQRAAWDAHFYGLPVKSDRVLFILDTSDSMKLKTTNENPAAKWKQRGPITGEGVPPPPPPPEEILSGPKIEVAKHEIKKALKKLKKNAKFDIIAFNSAVTAWKDQMMDASDKNVADALTWMDEMKPVGSTYVDGALRLGFRIAGLGATDKAYPEVNVDTIILLSDGAPTEGDSGKADGSGVVKSMDPEVVLQHVREWNQYKRVVINCIGVDPAPGVTEFLQKLATENGGIYIDR